MSKFESMSDCQLSAEVAGRKFDDILNISSVTKSTIEIIFVNGQRLLFTINSWADMGSIIEEHKINLTYEGGFKHVWESNHIKHIDEYDVDCIGQNEHKNPLRAAAITFLTMMGVQNV